MSAVCRACRWLVGRGGHGQAEMARYALSLIDILKDLYGLSNFLIVTVGRITK